MHTAREQVAALINAKPEEIVFTSGATESDNMALKGIAWAYRDQGHHLITTTTEHKAVLDTCETLEKQGFEVTYVPVDRTGVVDPDDIRKAITPQTILISVMYVNSEVGTIAPLTEIGAIAREHGVLTIVDTVSGLGSEVLRPEGWGMDVAIAGPQKCLGAPPGLSLLAVSPEAWKAMERRSRPLRGSYLSILDWKDTWLTRKVFPYTPSVSLVYALDAALQAVLEEGVDRYAARHAAVARACRRGVEALGLKLWAAREAIAGAAVTGVVMPDGVDDKVLRGHMRERYGVMISGGYGELAGKLFRLGHMGRAAHPAYMAAQLAILERSLADLGVPVELGAGVGAAMRAFEG